MRGQRLRPARLRQRLRGLSDRERDHVRLLRHRMRGDRLLQRVPRLLWGLRQQQQRQQLRDHVVLDLPDAGERDAHLQRHLVRNVVQQRLPSFATAHAPRARRARRPPPARARRASDRLQFGLSPVRQHLCSLCPTANVSTTTCSGSTCIARAAPAAAITSAPARACPTPASCRAARRRARPAPPSQTPRRPATAPAAPSRATPATGNAAASARSAPVVPPPPPARAAPACCVDLRRLAPRLLRPVRGQRFDRHLRPDVMYTLPAPPANGLGAPPRCPAPAGTCNSPYVKCDSGCCSDCRMMSGACTGLAWCGDNAGTCATVQKLQPDSGNAGSLYEFGTSVSLSGNLAVVGEPSTTPSTGAVFTYARQSNGTGRCRGASWRRHRAEPAASGRTFRCPASACWRARRPTTPTAARRTSSSWSRARGCSRRSCWGKPTPNTSGRPYRWTAIWPRSRAFGHLQPAAGGRRLHLRPQRRRQLAGHRHQGDRLARRHQ